MPVMPPVYETIKLIMLVILWLSSIAVAVGSMTAA